MNIHEIFEEKAVEARKYTRKDVNETEWDSFKRFVQQVCKDPTVRVALTCAIYNLKFTNKE